MSGPTSNSFASTTSWWDFKKYLKSPVSVNVTAVSITLGLFTWVGEEFECPCVDDRRRNAFASLFMLTPALLLALLSSWAMYEMKRPKKNVKFGLMTFVLVFLTWVEVVLLDGKTVCCMENSYPVDFTCHLINASAAEREQQHESCTATSKICFLSILIPIVIILAAIKKINCRRCSRNTQNGLDNVEVHGRPQRRVHVSPERADRDMVEMQALQDPVAEREGTC